jgi:hypothetical protein
VILGMRGIRGMIDEPDEAMGVEQQVHAV